MAEFALGLTKTAVEGTLSSVKSAIEEEEKIKERVQEDLEFITGEFQMMQSFLRGANAADRTAKNQVVRTWVKQLRDLAFDVEDCVDFVLSLDSPPWTNCLWRVLPSCCKAGAPPLPFDEAVAEIKRLKARLVDVSLRNTRYNLMIDSRDMLEQPIELPPPTTTTVSSSSAPAFHILKGVWQAAGKLHSSGTTLKDLLSHALYNEIQVMSLWVGSHATCADLHLPEVSYLIREAYNDPEICSQFECRAWVKLTVSHPAAAFNKQEFLNSMISQLCPSLSTDQIAAADNKDLLMQQVRTKSFLLIIQGISTVDEWDAIKMYLPDGNNGSRIIVSTHHLRTALVCTGDPYKVSELTRFSDGQSLYAFSKASVLRREMGKFIWQIRCGGVISVVGDLQPCMSYSYNEIYQLYMMLMYKHKDLDGLLVFKEQSWVDIPDPFDLEAFCIRMYINFQSGYFQAQEIAAVGLEGVAKQCRKYIVEGDCLVVINGLQSTEQWDMIKEKFVLPGESMANGTSIIVITKEASVAAHCTGRQTRCLDMEDVQADMVLSRLVKDTTSYGIGGKEYSCRAHIFFHHPLNAVNWEYFKLLGRENEVSAIGRRINKPGVISVWGHPRVAKSAIVRNVYCREMEAIRPGNNFIDFSWVDVPDGPFDLINFSWHLLLGFHSCDIKAKEGVAIAMLRGDDAPIEDCRRILHESKCLVVIDGLQSERDWEEIKAKFLSSEVATVQGSIVVITDKQIVARHCVVDDRVLHVKRQRPLRRPLTTPDRTHEERKEAFGGDAEFEIVGRHEEIEELYGAVHFNPSVLSLWGVAGVGKSALARAVYGRYIITHRSIKYSWVDVPDPFHLSEFSRRLLLGFHSDDLQAKEIAAVSIMEGHDAVYGACKLMRENKCILVIDGLRSTHDWDLIRAVFLTESNQSHRIIVVTKEETIAMHCVDDKSKAYNVKILTAADALRLFKKIAWLGKEHLSLDEKEFSKSIVVKCGGLPEVICALGEYSAKRLECMNIEDQTLGSISREIHHDFIVNWETKFRNLSGIFNRMQSYFDACPGSVKACIFYLSHFTEGQNIRHRRLLRRWIAEGYSTDTSASVTAEDYGEILLENLVNSSIIQVWKQKRSNSSYIKEKIVMKVNGLYHGYIISRALEDNLVFELEERCNMNSKRVGQHLTIRSNWKRDKLVYQSIDFTRLRSLTVFGEWDSFFLSTNANMRVLRVLDLEDTTSGVTDDVLEQIGKLLRRLKFLSLRGCKDITRVPDSFGGLRQLQTLDVRNTKIVTLPQAIFFSKWGAKPRPLHQLMHTASFIKIIQK